jgi:hypothetical protein
MCAHVYFMKLLLLLHYTVVLMLFTSTKLYYNTVVPVFTNNIIVKYCALCGYCSTYNINIDTSPLRDKGHCTRTQINKWPAILPVLLYPYRALYRYRGGLGK